MERQKSQASAESVGQMAAIRQLHARVYGIVQGVSFRAYTVDKARALGLLGWVGNRRDGSVEVLAEGDEDILKELETWLHIGSPEAVVDKVESQWLEASGDYSNFKTAYGLD